MSSFDLRQKAPWYVPETSVPPSFSAIKTNVCSTVIPSSYFLGIVWSTFKTQLQSKSSFLEPGLSASIREQPEIIEENTKARINKKVKYLLRMVVTSLTSFILLLYHFFKIKSRYLSFLLYLPDKFNKS